MSKTTDDTKYDLSEYISVVINIKEIEEKRKIRELNKRLSKATGD